MKKLTATKIVIWSFCVAIFSNIALPRQAFAQRSSTEQGWERLVRTPSVSGYEQKLAEEIREDSQRSFLPVPITSGTFT